MLPETLDKKDRLLLSYLQQDCSLSLQALSETVCLTTTPCWKRLKRLEDEGYIRARVALLNSEKLGLNLTAFVLIKTHQHSLDWFNQFVSAVQVMPEVMSFYRTTGEHDYLLQVQVADMKSYDCFYKKLLNSVPLLLDVTSSFAMEEIKYTTALPVSPSAEIVNY
ncbi:Lrp/AsnC family transcriptional regulator [Candidatus Erwinia haradaeae]|uniref:DNA-binding transcriptional activator DecR n=1 Tax=Candidatus Erwinia haradaeae TaxID=1922217 RepID=A0A451DAI4_9GAMM|nr:Lrp/AsnC family transcriptional regulator [Candidatus Erwinia haradaeae]VFP83303.1 DNA-binding transcriptional activator DecR [Candidatus Erwinia haradaeae]